MKTKRIPIMALVVSCALPLAGWATLYLDNLAQPYSYYADVKSNKWVASRFSVNDSSAAFRLDSLTLGTVYAAKSGGDFSVSIYNCSGTPGSETVGGLLGTLAGSANPDSLGQYTYTSGAITLQADTSYWLVTSVAAGGADYRVSYTYDTANSVPGGWVIPTSQTYSWSLDQGTTWGISGDYWPYRYQIEATAIPEPSTVGIAGVSLAVLLTARKLRKLFRPRPPCG
jgi:hypothetical protein